MTAGTPYKKRKKERKPKGHASNLPGNLPGVAAPALEELARP